MNINHGFILCCSYILGLFLTCTWGRLNANPTVFQWLIVSSIILVFLSINVVISYRYFWQLKWQLIVAIALTMFLAVGYFQWRIPRIQADSIFQVTQQDASLIGKPLSVYGEILSQPRTKELDKSSFWFKGKMLTIDGQQILIKSQLYVTHKSKNQQINQGDKVTFKGRLYEPFPAEAPWLFDFSKYLQTKNTFWGFLSEELIAREPTTDWLFKTRLKIVDLHRAALGLEKGALLSAMTLGRQAVDLPENIYTLWVQVGLAYTVAASGFHVSLLLGIMQWLTKHKSEKIQFIIGTLTLSLYILLTGFQPSILRAAFMGSAGLLAIALNRKVKPLGLLILTATILLVINPLWIWDLGFQLSFLATLGLFSSLEPIQKKLDFVPPTIATAIAIPIAASIWILPLLAYQFNVIALYSIPLSIVLSVPILIVSFGGMISAGIGLFLPLVGGAIATLVGLPLSVMLWLVQQVNQFPLSNLSIGTLHWSLLMVIYGVIMMIWLTPWGKSHQRVLSGSLLTVFITVLIIRNYTTTNLTVWNLNHQPTIIARAAGKTLVINPSFDKNTKYNLYPLLRREGINKVHFLLNLTPINKLNISQAFVKDFAVQKEFIVSDLTNLILPVIQLQEQQNIGQIAVEILQENPCLLEIKIRNEYFYLLGDRQSNSPGIPSLSKGYLITSAENLKDYQLLATIKPKQAIAIGSRQDHPLAANSIIRWAEEEMILQWTPNHDFVSISSQ